MYVLGLDIGSSGAKALVLRGDGSVAAEERIVYDATRGADGAVTLDAQRLRADVLSLFERAAGKSDGPIHALSISSVGEAIVPVDANENPLAPAILTADARLSGASAFWGEVADTLEVTDRTGLPLRDMWSVHGMRLHMANDAIAQDISGFRSLEEIIHAGLGLAPRIALSQAARSLLLDRRSAVWSATQLELAGIDPSMLTEPAMPGQVIGTLPHDVAGLSEGTLVASGGHDQFLAAIGAGADSRWPMWSSGTVESIAVLTNSSAIRPNVPSYPVDENTWMSPVPNLNGGQALMWMCRLLNIASPGDVLDTDDAARNECDPLIVVPTLGTTGGPDFITGATGLMSGLSYETTGADFVRAMARGIVHETALACSLFGEKRISMTEGFSLAGGGAQSTWWNRQRSAAFNTPVRCRASFDCAAIGAAALAWQAVLGKRPEIKTLNPLAEEIRATDSEHEAFLATHDKYLRLRALALDT